MTDKPDMPDIAAATVAHNGHLRDRIASLLELLRPVTPVEAADAIIKELCMRRDEVGLIHRYVTEWTDNG